MRIHKDGLTMRELHQRTLRRLWFLQTKGYELHVKWECEFKRELKANPSLRAMFNAIWVSKPLDPRADALRGGRTEPFQFYWRAPDQNWEIIWVDVVSYKRQCLAIILVY